MINLGCKARYCGHGASPKGLLDVYINVSMRGRNGILHLTLINSTLGS